MMMMMMLLTMMLLLMMLLMMNMIMLLSQRRAGFSNSMGNCSCLISWGYKRFRGQHIQALISIVASTQSFEVSLNKYTRFFDFNKLSIIDYSQIRSFQNENIISRPDKFQNNFSTLGGDFFSFIWPDCDSLTIY